MASNKEKLKGVNKTEITENQGHPEQETIITKIRKRQGLLITLLGLALFGFIVSSAVSSLDIFFDRSVYVGEVQGKKISYEELNKKFQEYLNNQSQNGPVDDQMRDMVLMQAWETIVMDRIYSSQTKPLGIDVSGEEIYNMFVSDNPNPVIQQLFTNYGEKPWDVNEVKKTLEAAKTNPQIESFLRKLEDYLYRTRLQEKYNNMFTASAFVSKAEAKRKYIEENTKFNIEYFAVNYATIPDSQVQVTDNDYLDYYNENKEQFKQLYPEAVIKYVVFPKYPSAKDSAYVYNEMLRIKDEWSKEIKDDSAFAASKSDLPIDNNFKSMGQLDFTIKNYIANAKKDSVIGPFLDGNYYKIIKIVDTKTDTLPTYKIKHILISFKGDTIAAQKKANEIKAKINKDNFAMLAAENSDDQQSKYMSGELGWITRNQFGPDFDKALKNVPVGTIVGPIKSNQGFHIVEVVEKDSRLMKVHVIAKEIFASTETEKQIERKAMEFAAAAINAESFEKLATSKGLDMRISQPINPNTQQIPGLQGGKDISRWALTGKKGDLSGVKVTENAYVVAYIKEKTEEGYKPLADVKDQIKPRIINKAKAKIIMQKMQGFSGSDFEALKNKYGTGAFVSKAENVSANNPIIPGIGNDPIVLGKILGMKANTVTNKPIAGLTGVYMIKVTKVDAPQNIDENTLKNQISTMQTNRKGQLSSKINLGLKDFSKVKDYRYKYSF